MDTGLAVISIIRLFDCVRRRRTHSNLVVNCDVVSWVSCAYRRELINLFFIRQAAGLAMTSHFRTTSHSRLFIIRHVTNM